VERLVRKIRVLVANRPRLMRDLVLATICEQPDIEIVGELADDRRVLETLGEKQPDYLILALDERGGRPPLCDSVLARFPEVKVLALAPGRGDSLFCWVSTEIHADKVENSEEGILRVLRGKL
jgi:DNA-binding NarL/FixJ family response regulator